MDKTGAKFSITIEDKSDIDIDVLDKALLLIPADAYIELLKRMNRRLSTCMISGGGNIKNYQHQNKKYKKINKKDVEKTNTTENLQDQELS